MTENEKLRALLAEAQSALQGVAEYDTDPDKSWTLTKAACREAQESIAAALAEPATASDPSVLDKVIRFDLDRVGIATREAEAVELVNCRATISTLRTAIERLQEERKPSDAHWERIWSICHDGSENACCKSHDGDD